jgi:hypothetical protein
VPDCLSTSGFYSLFYVVKRFFQFLLHTNIEIEGCLARSKATSSELVPVEFMRSNRISHTNYKDICNVKKQSCFRIIHNDS